MRNIVMIFLAAIIASPTFAATARWTGNSERVQTVTHKWVWKCEYDFLGQKFFRLFNDQCPYEIEVQ